MRHLIIVLTPGNRCHYHLGSTPIRDFGGCSPLFPLKGYVVRTFTRRQSPVRGQNVSCDPPERVGCKFLLMVC